jgi:hypothetical protein
MSDGGRSERGTESRGGRYGGVRGGSRAKYREIIMVSEV